MFNLKRFRCPTYRFFLPGIAICICLFTMSCSQNNGIHGAQARPDLAEQAFSSVNRHRVLAQLRELDHQHAISTIAEEHSLNMADGKTPFGHEGFTNRLEQLKARFAFTAAAENVGYVTGQSNPVDVIVNGWLGRNDHRANMLGDFQVSGIGVAQGPGGELFITQIYLRTD